MNWIVKTLRAAHDRGFLVYVYTGTHCVADGYIKKIDDETIVILDHCGYSDDYQKNWQTTAILICSITRVVPGLNCIDPERPE